MSTCVIDTNVWIYLFNVNAVQHEGTKKLFEYILTHSLTVCLTMSIVEEFIFIFLTILKSEKMQERYNETKRALDKIFLISPLVFLDTDDYKKAPYDMVDIIEKYKIDSHDAYILYMCLKHDVRYLVTFDKKLARAVKETGEIKVLGV